MDGIEVRHMDNFGAGLVLLLWGGGGACGKDIYFSIPFIHIQIATTYIFHKEEF